MFTSTRKIDLSATAAATTTNPKKKPGLALI
jgi:hypothetical protein